MEDKRSRIERRRDVRKTNSEKRKLRGIANLRIAADVGRVFSFLKSLYEDWAS